MSDRLCVLTATGRLSMAKTWTADGGIRPNDRALNCQLETVDVSDIHELSTLLASLAARPQACLIRGTPRGDPVALSEAQGDPKWKPGHVLRRKEVFGDQPLHYVMIDVDKFASAQGDPVADPLPALYEFIATRLPAAFHGASFHWQLSGSTGHPSKAGTLNAHLWFWIETPRTSAQMEAWSLATLGGDPAVFRVVQPNYTADPVFEAGAVDPVPVRSGFEQGFACDAVALDLDAAALAAVEPAPLERPRDAADALPDPVADYLWETGRVKGTGKGGALQVECPFGDLHSNPSGDDEAEWFLEGTGGKPGGFHCLHGGHAGLGKITTTQFLAAIGYTEQEVTAEFDVVEVPADPPPVRAHLKPFASAQPLPNWERDKADRVLPTSTSVGQALARPDICGARLVYDEFKAQPMIEWHDNQGVLLPLGNSDNFRLCLQLERAGFKNPSDQLVERALNFVAHQNRFDSAQDWINRLQWDGVPRVETFFVDCWGVEDSPYARAAARYTWTALAGRVVRPGCKADMVPVLIGEQGLRKTSGVQAMCPEQDSFVELDFTLGDKELSYKIRGKLIGELGEMRGLSGREAEASKQWISRGFEEFREVFQRRDTKFQRRLVVIGTGNREGILEDETGNRRWLPMIVGKVDDARIAAERDQLWAEGKALFCANGHVPEWEAAQTLAEAEHSEFKVEDVWEDVISAWLETDAMDDAEGQKRGSQPFKTVDVLVGALGYRPDAIKRTDQLRAAKALRNLQFFASTVRTDGAVAKRWTRKI